MVSVFCPVGRPTSSPRRYAENPPLNHVWRAFIPL